MEPAGTIKAKGKETETSLYTPTTAGELSVTSDHVDFGLVGMEQETSAVAGFISSCTASSNRSAASGIASGARLLVIQGAVGMGKTALLHHAGSLPSSLGYQKSLTLHIEASASHKPFNICHKILYALLEADMVLDPEEFMCLEVMPAPES